MEVRVTFEGKAKRFRFYLDRARFTQYMALSDDDLKAKLDELAIELFCCKRRSGMLFEMTHTYTHIILAEMQARNPGCLLQHIEIPLIRMPEDS